MLLKEIQELVANEKECYSRIKKMRKFFTPTELIKKVSVETREQALLRGIYICKDIPKAMASLGIKFNNLDAGHAIGHLVRDYVNALMLISRLEADPRHLFIGFVGGTLHDAVGCALIDRYCDRERIIRHAEVSALIFDEILQNFRLDLNETESLYIRHAFAAHTHFLETQKIMCKDGVERTMDPYQDMDGNGNPIWAVWFTRWIDRLDVCTPAFVGRHYLTLHRDHSDFDGEKFYTAKFANHLKPQDKIKDNQGKDRQTMLGHIKMFHNSQNNSTPYGRHDYGAMTALRNSSNARLGRIIKAVENPQTYTPETQGKILKAWSLFLGRNVEPANLGVDTARQLEDKFSQLDQASQTAWVSGFYQTMAEYRQWAKPITIFLDHLLPDCLSLEPLTSDVREIIRPDSEWVEIIRQIK